jgi:predicted dehydrogenase
MQAPIRFGILGNASINEATIPAMLATPGCELVALASRSLKRAQEAAARYDIPHVFDDYAALLDSGLIDAVYIPLPNSLHVDWCLRAMQAGLHVLCEKPLAVTLDDAMRVAKAAEETGRTVIEGYMFRHHPIYDTLLALIAAGRIGRVKQIRADFAFMLDEPDSIVASVELGGGALLDIGGYPVQVARLVMGREPLAAMAVARFDGVDRSISGVLTFADGVQAQVSASIERAEYHRVEIHGETGSLVLEQPWKPGLTSGEIRLERHDELPELIETPGGNAYTVQMGDFVNALLADRAPRFGLDDALKTAAVMDALLLSAKTGQVQRIESHASTPRH